MAAVSKVKVYKVSNLASESLFNDICQPVVLTYLRW